MIASCPMATVTAPDFMAAYATLPGIAAVIHVTINHHNISIMFKLCSASNCNFMQFNRIPCNRVIHGSNPSYEHERGYTHNRSKLKLAHVFDCGHGVRC